MKFANFSIQRTSGSVKKKPGGDTKISTVEAGQAKAPKGYPSGLFCCHTLQKAQGAGKGFLRPE